MMLVAKKVGHWTIKSADILTIHSDLFSSPKSGALDHEGGQYLDLYPHKFGSQKSLVLDHEECQHLDNNPDKFVEGGVS